MSAIDDKHKSQRSTTQPDVSDRRHKGLLSKDTPKWPSNTLTALVDFLVGREQTAQAFDIAC